MDISTKISYNKNQEENSNRSENSDSGHCFLYCSVSELLVKYFKHSCINAIGNLVAMSISMFKLTIYNFAGN